MSAVLSVGLCFIRFCVTPLCALLPPNSLTTRLPVYPPTRLPPKGTSISERGLVSVRGFFALPAGPRFRCHRVSRPEV
jgi:hypothetical protein